MIPALFILCALAGWIISRPIVFALRRVLTD